MNKLVLLAGVALLASCGAKEEAAPPEVAASDTVPIDVGTTAAPVASVTPGSYEFKDPAGKLLIDTLAEDGTYVERDEAGKVVENGKWSVKDGKTCFAPDGKDEMCFTESARAADGSFTATAPDGSTTKVAPHKG